jgi:arsenate reductase
LTPHHAPHHDLPQPRCGTSRNTLALLRERGFEPEVIEYLHTPPSRETLRALIAATGQPTLALVRTKEALFTELGLDAPGATDALVDAMLAHPILINRPIVVTPLGARLCRPAEQVLEPPARAGLRPAPTNA